MGKDRGRASLEERRVSNAWKPASRPYFWRKLESKEGTGPRGSGGVPGTRAPLWPRRLPPSDPGQSQPGRSEVGGSCRASPHNAAPGCAPSGTRPRAHFENPPPCVMGPQRSGLKGAPASCLPTVTRAPGSGGAPVHTFMLVDPDRRRPGASGLGSGSQHGIAPCTSQLLRPWPVSLSRVRTPQSPGVSPRVPGGRVSPKVGAAPPCLPPAAPETNFLSKTDGGKNGSKGPRGFPGTSSASDFQGLPLTPPSRGRAAGSAPRGCATSSGQLRALGLNGTGRSKGYFHGAQRLRGRDPRPLLPPICPDDPGQQVISKSEVPFPFSLLFIIVTPGTILRLFPERRVIAYIPAIRVVQK